MEISEASPIGGAPPAAVRVFTKLRALWRWQKKRKALIVQETASLGERRFLAVVQFERQRFLIGAGPNSITLLSLLPDQLSPDQRISGVDR